MAQLLGAPAFTHGGRELLRQINRHLLAIVCRLTLKHLGIDAFPHLPVEPGQFRIYRHRSQLMGGLDQAFDFAEQGGRHHQNTNAMDVYAGVYK